MKSNKNFLKFITLGIILFIIICMIVNTSIAEGDNSNKDRIVAHAMGEISGLAYTNSMEAFENTYNKGTRYFEVDFSNTADHRLVAIHDWEQWFDWINMDIAEQPYRSYSHTDFMETKIAYKYTPLDLDTIAQLMIEYPDIYVITDTKRPAEKLFKDDISRIYITLEYAQKGLSDRLIIQAYNENDIKIAQTLLPDKNIIFTTYMSGLNISEISELCNKYPDLYAITVEKDKITKEIIEEANNCGIKIFVHTVNSIDDMNSLIDEGVYGFYTDTLSLADIKK